MKTPTKQELVKELLAIIDIQIGEPWNPKLEEDLMKRIKKFIASYGLGARHISLTCDESGMVEVDVRDYYWLKDCN